MGRGKQDKRTPAESEPGYRDAAPPPPPQKSREDEERDYLRENIMKMQGFLSKVIPKNSYLDAPRLCRIAINAIEDSLANDRDRKLANCSFSSIARALIHCAELGLEPGGALGHAYLIPYGGTCQFQVGVWGFVELARRSGQVIKVWADVIYSEDEYEIVRGSEPRLYHKPAILPDDKRGEPVVAYACAKLISGDVAWDWVSEEDCQRARSANRGKSPAWDEWPDEQRKKVAIKRARKTWPFATMDSALIARAMELDEGKGLTAEHQAGLQKLLSTSMIGTPAGAGAPTGLDAIVAANEAAKERVVDTQGENVREPSKPANEPPPKPTHDPNAGEVPPEEEPSDAQLGLGTK